MQTDPTDVLVERLERLARNFFWAWQPEVMNIFRDLDPRLWTRVNHNPIRMLQELPREAIAERSRDLAIESRVVYALRRLDDYLAGEDTYGLTHAGPINARPVAYFSAEFGVHESLPVYAGGLGVLAGDHMKAASDLGIPIVGVGLFYVQGYFRQQLDAEGWQQETYGEIEVEQLPMRRATDGDGKPIVIGVETPKGTVHAGIWRAPIGRNELILLDADVEENGPKDRLLTSRLYGGDENVRLRQEILLGIGGMRALAALGIVPSVVHMNEGHAALAALEYIRVRMERDGLSFDAALRDAQIRSVFTTHTPVPAGHDRFPESLVEENLATLREALGLEPKRFMSLGRVDPENEGEPFCMTVLAIKTSRFINGVSHLHGHVSRQMWKDLWPGRPEQEIPIGHITNGVHIASWLAPQMLRVYEPFLPRDYARRWHEPQTWAGLMEIDDGELWEAHQVMRHRLIDFVRRRTGVAELDPYALTLGFARRFATYKRAVLLAHDEERLAALLGSAERPVQILFAGKAHPKDEPGKRFIQRIWQLSQDPRFRGRIVFIPDYDIGVARALCHGVDGWVNTPRRPLEASGTSGMKVLLNGGLNISILDGWWAECYDGTNGFAIGSVEGHVDDAVQDARDAESLYRVLEEEVVPLFYARDEAGIPHGWVHRMKRALVTGAWRFSADRQVIDYLNRAYLPAAGGTWVG
ncbi:MAG: alpha-glucan family phosphorylase [Deltaproteobacteria bacterium]|nr:MAG: alpha-glucan family phosphorylase [Deltaproteobacteria bacterium]